MACCDRLKRAWPAVTGFSGRGLPVSGTSVGRIILLICSMDWRSGDKPGQTMWRNCLVTNYQNITSSHNKRKSTYSDQFTVTSIVIGYCYINCHGIYLLKDRETILNYIKISKMELSMTTQRKFSLELTLS